MIDEVDPTKIYFDTNIFRDAFEGTDEKAAQLKSIFDAARKAPERIVTSELTLAELLGTEAPGQGWVWQKRFYLGLIVFSRFIELCPVTREILLETGEL
jgi:hypothetical protein